MTKKEIVKIIKDVIFNPSTTKKEVILNLILENHFIPDEVTSYNERDLDEYINGKINDKFIEIVNNNIEVIGNINI